MRTRLFVGSQLLASLFFIGVLSSASSAQTLDKPKGPVILTVQGKINQRNAGDFAEFDAEMLNALPVTRFTTVSPWHKNPTTFSGPSLQSVLQAVGAKGKMLKMIAIDKYEISVPFDDAAQFEPVLALRINDKTLTIRLKGPIFMIYPFDQKSETRNDTYYSRSIWQLQRIVVE